MTESDYAAVQGAHALAESLAPAGSELSTWWLDGVESLARSGDQDLELFVRFTQRRQRASPRGAISRRPPASGCSTLHGSAAGFARAMVRPARRITRPSGGTLAFVACAWCGQRRRHR